MGLGAAVGAPARWIPEENEVIWWEEASPPSRLFEGVMLDTRFDLYISMLLLYYLTIYCCITITVILTPIVIAVLFLLCCCNWYR